MSGSKIFPQLTHPLIPSNTRVVNHGYRLLREVVVPAFLEVFKALLDMAMNMAMNNLT